MNDFIEFIEHFFWALVWLFLLLIVGFWFLGWVQQAFPGTWLGSLAGGIASRAEPQ